MGVQDGLGAAGGARGPEDEGGPRGVGAGSGQGADAVGPDDGGRRGGPEHPFDLHVGQAGVDGHEDGAGQPDPHHGDHDIGSVGELDGHRLFGLDAGLLQFGGHRPGLGLGISGGHRVIDRVQQRLLRGEGMVHEQGGEIVDLLGRHVGTVGHRIPLSWDSCAAFAGLAPRPSRCRWSARGYGIGLTDANGRSGRWPASPLPLGPGVPEHPPVALGVTDHGTFGIEDHRRPLLGLVGRPRR